MLIDPKFNLEENKKKNYYYINDGSLYMLWRYLNIHRLSPFLENAYGFTPSGITSASLCHIFPPLCYVGGSFSQFLITLTYFDIELKDIKFCSGEHKLLYPQENKRIIEYIKTKPQSKLKKALKNLMDDNASWKDIFEIFTSSVDVDKLDKYEMIESLITAISFEPSPFCKNVIAFRETIKRYIDLFIESRLHSMNGENRYCFSQQRSIFLKKIVPLTKKYGSFLTIEEVVQHKNPYLPIHTLIAMEYKKFIVIKNIESYEVKKNKDLSTSGYYKIQIEICPLFQKKITNTKSQEEKKYEKIPRCRAKKKELLVEDLQLNKIDNNYKKNNIIENLAPTKTLIYFNNKKETYYYKDNPLNLDTKNKGNIYYLIFECLYNKSDVSGFCSYKVLKNYLKKNGKEVGKGTIKNGIDNLMRYSKIPKKAPDGKEVIQKRRGKGIIFYNPEI